MNIFVVQNDPVEAARDLCDQHIVKMPLETAQLLCNVRHLQGLDAPYAPFNPKHPAAQWTAESRENYRWLLRHGSALCEEFTRRYQRRHRAENVIDFCADRAEDLHFDRQNATEFVQCMPEIYRIPHQAVEAYRAYYRGEKSRFARWKYSPIPDWFKI